MAHHAQSLNSGTNRQATRLNALDPLIMLDDRRVPGLPNGSMILLDAERCGGIGSNTTETLRSEERLYRSSADTQ